MAHLEKPPIALSFDLDGVNDKVTVPHHDSLNLDEYTIESWINIASLPSPSDSHFEITVKVAYNVLRFFVRKTTRRLEITVEMDGVTKGYAHPTVLDLNTWYHVASTVKSGEQAITLNGVKTVLGTDTYTSLGKNALELRIGWYNDLLFSHGFIATIGIYNRALSQAEISDLYNIRRNIMDGCVLKLGTLGLVRGGGTQWLDESPYKNHGTVYGAKRVRCCHCNVVRDYGT